jgi:2-keto-4-pentenoate hydratase
MDTEKIAEAAEILWRARASRSLIGALPAACRPANLEEGYAIQDRMGAISGQPTLGWKIAATSAAGMRHIGVSEPLAGRLFRDFVLEEGAILATGPMHMRVAEAEFAFRMGEDLPTRAHDYTLEEALAAVDGLHLAIEVPDSRIRDFARAGAATLAADDACAGWWLLGREIVDWRGLDLIGLPVRFLKNGALAHEGSGANVLGDPRRALAWLANDRAKRGEGLKAGDLVTTGTCTTPLAIGPGDAIIAEFGPLGTIAAEFT